MATSLQKTSANHVWPSKSYFNREGYLKKHGTVPSSKLIQMWKNLLFVDHVPNGKPPVLRIYVSLPYGNWSVLDLIPTKSPWVQCPLNGRRAPLPLPRKSNVPAPRAAQHQRPRRATAEAPKGRKKNAGKGIDTWEWCGHYNDLIWM